MRPTSRRSFLISGGAGVVGVAGASAGAIALAGPAKAAHLSPKELEALNQPVLVHVLDAHSGKVELLVGDRQVIITNKALVATVLRATL